MFSIKGFTIYSDAVNQTLYIVVRLMLMVIITTVLTATTKPLDLTLGIEKLLKPFEKVGVPAHIIAMIISIALRFIPTLIEETQRIMNAQASRGVDLENGSIKEKIMAILSLIVPLFVSAFDRADQLANAMEARGYDPSRKRTRYKVLKMQTIRLCFNDFKCFRSLCLYWYLGIMIVKALVSYDGFNYAGWQKQENALGIQQVIEEALYKITKENVDVVASGRTDAGVHALGQVFHFETSKNIPAIQYERALNALLPKDIRILKTEEMPDDFHARFSAVGKRYDYFCSYDIKNPFNYKYRNLLTKKLDIETMKNASKVFLGSHDFTSFASSKIDPRKPRVKTISNIEINEEGTDVHFIFEGTGFLRYQVRMMTGTLIAVGQHKIDIDDVQRMLDAKDKSACRYNAPSCGLYLVEVKYNETN